MQEGPQVEKYPMSDQFLGTYVIVMGISTDNHDNNICAQKLNRNRTYFNPRSLWHTVLLKVDEPTSKGASSQKVPLDVG